MLDQNPKDTLEELAASIKAARRDFAKLFEDQSTRRDPRNAAPLHVLVMKAALLQGSADLALNDHFAFLTALRHASAHGWLKEFLAALATARFLKPKGEGVDKLVTTITTAFELEATQNPHNGYADPLEFARSIHLAARRVCNIMINDKVAGTGFLVGPQAILTNWHVVRTLFDKGKLKSDALKDLKVRFNNLAGMNPANQGDQFYPVCEIEHWSEAYGNEYVGKEIRNPKEFPWSTQPEHLDYALLRVQEAIGLMRGSYRLMPDKKPKIGAFFELVHHPGQFALKVSQGEFICFTNSTTQVRVDHTANTQRGSSGGLCLQRDELTNTWLAVAIHQAARKTEKPAAGAADGKTTTTINQAVPLYKIAPKIAETAKVIKGFVPLHKLTRPRDLSMLNAPVFGRLDFQKRIVEAATGEIRIICVRVPPTALGASPRRRGITFSHDILRSMLPAEEHVLIDISAGEVPTDARAFAKHILDKLEMPGEADANISLPHPEHVHTTAYISDHLIKAFSARLESAARGRKIWIVIDDLHKVEVPDMSGRWFLEELYRSIASIPSLRIVLLGTTRDLTFLSATQVGTERLDSPPDQIQIRAWLERRIGSNLAVDPQILDFLSNLPFALANPQHDITGEVARIVRTHFDAILPAAGDT